MTNTNIDIKSIINKSTTMDINEKQYWIDILPNMNTEQKITLWQILEMEETKKQMENTLYSNCK